MYQQTTMPNSKESEMMVLGCMLNSFEALNHAAGCLNITDFYWKEHQVIYSALKSAYPATESVGIHIIGEKIKQEDGFEGSRGFALLATLSQYAGTGADIEEYVRLLQKKAALRRILQVAQDVQAKALSEPDDVERVLDEAKQLFSGIELFER